MPWHSLLLVPLDRHWFAWVLTWSNSTEQSFHHRHFTASTFLSRDHFYAQYLFRMTGIAIKCFLHSSSVHPRARLYISMSSARIRLLSQSLLPSPMSAPTQSQKRARSPGLSSDEPQRTKSRKQSRTSGFQRGMTPPARSSGVNPFPVATSSLPRSQMAQGLGRCTLSNTRSM
jgi:hypothetical protein